MKIRFGKIKLEKFEIYNKIHCRSLECLPNLMWRADYRAQSNYPKLEGSVLEKYSLLSNGSLAIIASDFILRSPYYPSVLLSRRFSVQYYPIGCNPHLTPARDRLHTQEHPSCSTTPVPSQT